MKYGERWSAMTARVRNDAIRNMTDVVERAASFDEEIATEAAMYLITFINRVPWMNPRYQFERQAYMVGLPAVGEAIFGYFVILEPEDQTEDAYASWHPETQYLIVGKTMDPRQLLSGIILFHELFHAHDARLVEKANQVPFEDGRFPAESDAWRFQSRLLNARLGGAYAEEIGAMADRAMTGTLQSFPLESDVQLPSLRPKFLRMFSPKQPDRQIINTLLMQVMYDLAYELIGRRAASPELVAEQRAALYMRFLHAKRPEAMTPRLVAFVRDFIGRW